MTIRRLLAPLLALAMMTAASTVAQSGPGAGWYVQMRSLSPQVCMATVLYHKSGVGDVGYGPFASKEEAHDAMVAAGWSKRGHNIYLTYC